jgi:uncharacterized protein with PIN domain
MVIDTSAILAVLFKETHAKWVATHLNKHIHSLKMCTVNLTETLIHLQNRQPKLFPVLEETLFNSGIQFIAPDQEQAHIAARARLKYPLNLGDCFAYALAVKENCSILTLDKDFKALDNSVIHPY